ncbi:WD40-repeat-containing domain protein [Bisporella sp. PMI_857]|nr:WD40-repeat-containing domain protein [Bisporella sp. PMI_857]
MADPFGIGAGIVGVLDLSLQITQVVIEFRLNWKDAPDNVREFMTELGTLETVLFGAKNNIILNPGFAAAFQNIDSGSSQRNKLFLYARGVRKSLRMISTQLWEPRKESKWQTIVPDSTPPRVTMRLLELQPDGDICLTRKFLDSEIPRYAILLHTWGDENEEVTIQDMAEGSNQGKAGFEKIKFCGEQAARDELQCFWVDSCCIGKYSRTEVADAINSMFRWYHNAAKCYVYLTDVPSPPCEPTIRSACCLANQLFGQADSPNEAGHFKSSLLLGRSNSFPEKATRIDVLALRGASLSQFGIRERLSWAYDRETTREEDSAYCLLGILDVCMPLLYGEGRSPALERLTKVISRRINSESSSQSTAPFSKYRNAFEYQSRLGSADGVVLEGHCGWVNPIAFAPNGDQLASASNDRTVRLWDTTTGQQIWQFDRHNQYISALASASSDQTVRLWNSAIGEQVQQFEGHIDKVNDVAFSPNGQQLVSASDRVVKLWNTATGEQTGQLEGHEDHVRAVSFSPDDKQLASTSFDRSIRLWVTETGEQSQRYEGHNNHVRTISFSPDGLRLASGSSDKRYDYGI